MDAQLKKGALPLCILFIIRQEARYGYEIIGEVRAVFPDVYDGSIYTVLRRLAADGYARTELRDEPSGGPTRKYYAITPEGLAYLEQLRRSWHEMQERLNRLGV